MGDHWLFAVTVLVFAITYLGLALGRWPWLRTDRTGIALGGAAALLATGALTFKEAVAAVDFETIALLLGMMVVVSYLHLAGFFSRLTGWALCRVHSPRGLLALTMLLGGILSAVLVNDVVCVALTPLVLHLALQTGTDPKPHLIGLAVAANIGSTATLTGNPQNMIIGGLSHVSYLRFAAKLAPIALIGLVVAYGIMLVLCRDALRSAKKETNPTERDNKTSSEPTPALPLIKGVVVAVAAVCFFFAGAPMAVVALTAAAVLLADRIEPQKVYARIDWGLLLMFAGLFVVVHTFEIHVVRRWGVEHWTLLLDHPVDVLSAVSATLSNLVSNVPAVLLFEPVIPAMPAPAQETAWLALAMSSTLAGNLTLLGSVANLIVAEGARREGVEIGFREYARIGVPVTLATLVLGVAWLKWVPY